MLIFETGNLLKADAEALVNTVNTVGVMGKGIALQFKEAFPENFKAYSAAVKKNEVQLGKMFVTRLSRTDGLRYLINFPTKGHWRFPSKLEWIESGLQDLRQVIVSENIRSVALPPLGCGNGGLDWADVKPLIERHLASLDAKIIVFEPDAAVKAMLQQENSVKAHLTNARAMLLAMLQQYQALGENACEFAAEKLAYFLQRFGETQLKLDFQKHYYGPYSGKVRHVLYALNGTYIRGYEQKNARPFDEFRLVREKMPEIKNWLSDKLSDDEKKRLGKVTELLEGFQSPFALELLATVDFILHEKGDFSVDGIRQALSEWSSRKSGMFQKRHIELAIHHLRQFERELYQPHI